MDVLLNDGRAQLVEPYPDGITKDILPGEHNSYRTPTLNVRIFDQTLVVYGHSLRTRPSTYEGNLARLHRDGKERIAAHFNWYTKDGSKEGGSEELGLYFLNKKGHCELSH